jgi:hypothetical protein
MPVQPHSVLQIPGISNDALRIVQWTLANGDTGQWVALPFHTDYTVEVVGTFGAGGSVQLEGSNDVVNSPSVQTILNDARGKGNPLVFTSADIRTVLDCPTQIRPNCTAGDGTTSLIVRVKAIKRAL